MLKQHERQQQSSRVDVIDKHIRSNNNPEGKRKVLRVTGKITGRLNVVMTVMQVVVLASIAITLASRASCGQGKPPLARQACSEQQGTAHE